MNLPGMAVRRRTAFAMLFILMVGSGVFAFLRMGLDYFPAVDIGTVVIMTALPGAGPEEVETLVTKVIEDAVGGVESVRVVESTSSASMSGITVKLAPGADIETVEGDVRKAVERIKASLPENASDPMIVAMESNFKPLVLVSFVSGALSSHELRTLVEDEIVPVLSRVQGISDATVSGGEERIILVEPDPVLMFRRGIPLARIYGALSAAGSDQPGGTLEFGNLEVPVGVRTGFRSVDQIMDLAIGAWGGVPVRLRDVAKVEAGYREQSNRVTLDGSNTVTVVFRKTPDANAVQTCRALEAELERIGGAYSRVLDYKVIYTQESFIAESAESLAWSGVQAILLAAAVLVFFLGSFANAGISGVSMPVSFIATFAAMRLFGVNLNIMSLAGLSISIGMIVDNSVVVLENIHRLRVLGAGVRESAEKGASQVGTAVTASTITTVAAFIPMLFVKGMTGQIFRDLSITISSAILISLFVSLTLIPLLATLPRSVVRKHRPGSVLGWMAGVTDRLEHCYARILSRCLARRKLVAGLLAAAVVVSAGLMYLIPIAFLPELGEGVIEVKASLPRGTGLAFTDSVARALADSLSAVALPGDLEHCWVQTGRSDGIGAVLFGADASCRLNISLYFRRDTRLPGAAAGYEGMVREVLEGFPGLEFTVQTLLPIGNEFPVTIAVYGTEPAQLRDAGETLKKALATIPGTVDHRSSLDEWVPKVDFVPNPEAMSARGVSPAEVSAEITLGLMGVDATTLYGEGSETPVNLRYPERFRSTPEALAALPVMGAPLDSWGTLQRTLVPRTVNHRNGVRCVLVSCGIAGRPLGSMESDIEAVMDTLDLSGARWELLGDIPDRKEAFGAMQLAIAVAVLLVYMVMAAQFESLLEPFILIFEIPMAMVGVVLVHLVLGMTMGLTSLVGILMLAGIVVNNGIVLVDFANTYRKERGGSASDAVMAAGRTRMRPILMTAATTILALVPLSLGGSPSADAWAPMARTVAAGMLLATPLTLLALPVLYVLSDAVRTGRRRRR